MADLLQHGTVGRYRKGCRCDPCRTAKKIDKDAYYARRKAREAAGLPPNPPGCPAIPLSQRPHGDWVTYSKGCRCAQCTAANAEYGRRRRAQRLQENPEPVEVTLLRKWADELGYRISKKRAIRTDGV
jgi:hypothetical protein